MTAGAIYFLITFSAAFVIGVLRTLVVAPLVGAVVAVLIELPLVLANSWIACLWVTRKLGVAHDLQSRAAMGATAFLLLMIAELVMSVILFDRTVTAHFASFANESAQIGLAGQIVFALFPVVQLYWPRDRAS
ncbi:MAG: hypothetical protein ABL973_11515 [Micropepsaceae bacterium]